jgi:hypothetical protein
MIRQGLQEEIDEYFGSGRLNQSKLKNIIKGVSYLEKDEKKLYYEEKGHFIIGSAVDTILSQGDLAFERQYHPSLVKKPSDAIKSIVQWVFDNYEVPGVQELQYLERYILDACDYHAYQKNWKEETRINKIILEGSSYFSDLIQSKGKQVISKIENDIIDNIVMSFRSHKFTAEYFKDEKDVDIFYQVPIYFTYMGEDCKALLDMIIIDRYNEVIYPIDFKTTGGNVLSFPGAVKSLRYDIQAAFYTEALLSLTAPNKENPAGLSRAGELLFPKLKGYKIYPFQFMVETTGFTVDKITGEVNYHQGSPLMFTLSEEQRKIGKFGRPELNLMGSTHDDRETYRFLAGTDEQSTEKVYLHEIKYAKIAGFIDGIGLFKWYEENGYEFDKEVIENNGNIII